MPLSTVTASTFYQPKNAASTVLTSPYAPGAGSMNVTSVTSFGNAFPLRITAVRSSDSARAHYLCTGIIGNVLTITVMDGYTDLSLTTGDTIACRASAETFADTTNALVALQTAINQHANFASTIASPTFTGTPTAPTPTTNDNTTNLATTAFVKSQNYLVSSNLNTCLAVANNLSDLASAPNARANLGLGTIATHATTEFATAANNLSDLASAPTARTNLGLGTIATHATTEFTTVANNLSDLASAPTARTNLGLGTIAIHAAAEFATVANNLSDLANVTTARTNLGLGTASTLTAGTANGVATLDSGGKIPTSQIPSAIVNGLEYAGTWNATTNTPTLTSGTGTKGTLYKVATSGTTTLDGTSIWTAGDMALFDGTTWDKVDGLASEVITVAGRAGNVVIAESDVTNLTSDLALKASLVSPAFTATPTAPTASLATNTNQIATTAFVLANAGAVTPGGSNSQVQYNTTGSLGASANFTYTVATGALLLTAGSAAGVPLTLRNYTASPTGDLLDLQTNGGTTLVNCDVNGYMLLQPFQWAISIGTPAITGTDKANWQIVPFACKLIKWQAAAKTAPTGASLILDVLRSTDSGTTFTSIWTSSGNKPTLAASAKTGNGSTFDNVTTLSVGDLLRLDISQVGSTVAGQDITLRLSATARNN